MTRALLTLALAGCAAPCSVPAGLVAVSDTCPALALDTCDPGPRDGTWDGTCTATIDRVCGDVTIGGRLGAETWDSVGCGYRIE